MQPQPPNAGNEAVAPWRSVPPRVRWEQLILPAAVIEALQSISRHARAAQADFGDPAREATAGGTVALFTGERATGKRMAAQVIAGDLGTSVIEVDTPTVCARGPAVLGAALWRIRQEAARDRAVLLFADAGAYLRDAGAQRRTRPGDYSWDLISRCADYPGLTILCSRQPARLDPAATTQLAHQLSFPFPDAELRARLWRAYLPTPDRLDERQLEFLASSFLLAGGAIRECCEEAARIAARANRRVELGDVAGALEAYYEDRLASAATREALASLRESDLSN